MFTCVNLSANICLSTTNYICKQIMEEGVFNVSNEYHMNMQHDESGHLPSNIKQSKRAKFPIGTKIKLLTDHMSDMLNAEAIVVGVYETTTYSVTYTEQGTGNLVEDHRWLVDGEIHYEGDGVLGDKVRVHANHMPGMNGATGTIVAITKEPVYMIDYFSTDQNRWVKNHQWVVESEVEAWE